MSESFDVSAFSDRIELFIGEARAAFRSYHLLHALECDTGNGTSNYWIEAQNKYQNHGQMPLVVIDALEDHLTLFVTRLWHDPKNKNNDDLKRLRKTISREHNKKDGKHYQVLRERWSSAYSATNRETQLSKKLSVLDQKFRKFDKSGGLEKVKYRRDKFTAHSDKLTKVFPHGLLLETSMEVVDLVLEINSIWNPQETVLGFEAKFAEIQAQSFWGSLYIPDKI